MTNYNQPPKYPAEWWSANKDSSTFTGPAELRGPDIANEHAWVVVTMLGINEFGTQQGYVGTVFPSAADVLLWLRHDILATEITWRESNNFNCRGINKLVDIIEALPRAASWDQYLGQIGPAFGREFYKTEILRWMPIHEVLNSFAEKVEKVRNAAFMAISGHPEVSRQSGRWHMPQVLWDRVNEFIVSRNN